MSVRNEKLTIGRLAKAAGVNVETVRYYQRRGLLVEPERPAGGIRRYRQADLERLGFIRSAQRLGFSLQEVGELLSLDDGTRCAEASQLAERKLQDIRGKIAHLERIGQVLESLIRDCRAREDTVSCPLIASLQTGSAHVETRSVRTE